MQETFEPSVMQSNILPLDASDGADWRQYRRYLILKLGLIYMADGCIDRQIVDLSTSGVRVRPVRKLKEQQGTYRFFLGRLGAFEVEICWKGKHSIGIWFGHDPAIVAQRYSDLLPVDFLAAA